MAAAIARGREERKALLDKLAGTLALPPTMHLHQLIKTDTSESLLPRLSEEADLMVLVMIIWRVAGTYRTGHTARTVASTSLIPS
jgi:hypothetical protein